MKYIEKTTKILFLLFIIVLSINVLLYKVPEMKYVKETVESLEDSQETLMAFSGTTMAASVALSALPDDFASPLASTISDLNVYLIFMLIVVFVEKLVVLEGTKIALACIIPLACVLYAVFVLTTKDVWKNFAKKLLILGISIIVVIPISTHLTEAICADYLTYVDETIAETQSGAEKINDVMSTSDKNATIFDKLSAAFENAIQSITDLLTYFENVVKKCMNSIAIMIVTTFVLPFLILILFRWLLKELFALNIPTSNIQLKDIVKKIKGFSEDAKLLSTEEQE